MAVSLADTLKAPEAIFLDESFYVFLETNLQYLLSQSSLRIVSIKGSDAEKYRGDFYGLLDFLGISKNSQYVSLRMNGMRSSSDFDGLLVEIKIPGDTDVNELISFYQSNEG